MKTGNNVTGKIVTAKIMTTKIVSAKNMKVNKVQYAKLYINSRPIRIEAGLPSWDNVKFPRGRSLVPGGIALAWLGLMP